MDDRANTHVVTTRPHDGSVARAARVSGARPGEVGGELEVLVETTETVTGCRRCGVLEVPHCRREHWVRDVPWAGRAVLLVWSKRIWRCPEPA